MAHGILMGIDLLCVGIILRTGFTMLLAWAHDSRVSVYRVGHRHPVRGRLYGLGTAATITTALVLIVLRAISARMPSLAYVDCAGSPHAVVISTRV